MLDIIIPTFNGVESESFKLYLQKLASENRIIIINSGKNNFCSTILEDSNIQIKNLETQSRAQRINVGVAMAQGELILLHHPRSILEPDFKEELKNLPQDTKWGAFTHRFDMGHPLLSFTSWYSNKIRGDRKGIYYLDHCIFIKTKLAQEIFPIEDLHIFEDTEICLKLKPYQSKRLSSISTTSAIRFKNNGVYKQAIINQYLKLMFLLKKDHRLMNTLYEKNTKLNSNYDNK